MTTINQLSAVDTVVGGDQVPIYSSSNGDARKASMNVLKTFMQEGVTANDDKITQYAAPSATGFSVQIADDSDSIWLVLTPAAGYADGEIILPTLANCVEGQEILVNCTQAVTTLVVDGNGATVTGEPASLAANDFFRLRFEPVTDTWYRVG